MIDCVGRQLGKYHLVRLLGRGSFGDVYLGEHVEGGPQAAIKVLHEPLTNENINEFVNEAGLKRLRHESIVRLFDVGIGDGYIPFLAMEYAPNGSLADCHPRGTRLPLGTIISYVKPISAALQYVHEKGLIHCDVKPANLFIGSNGKVLLGDFGIAAIVLSTRSQEQQREKQNAFGSWPYAAPEQFVGKAVPASDQYSLAVVVYEWLCGEHPFQGGFLQLENQHRQNIPPPPLHEKMNISPAVEQVIIQRNLQKTRSGALPGSGTSSRRCKWPVLPLHQCKRRSLPPHHRTRHPCLQRLPLGLPGEMLTWLSKQQNLQPLRVLYNSSGIKQNCIC